MGAHVLDTGVKFHDLVACASGLESSHFLEVFALEVDAGRSSDLGQGVRGYQGSLVDVVLYAVVSLGYGLFCWKHVGRYWEIIMGNFGGNSI
jgi:hypothetical protein